MRIVLAYLGWVLASSWVMGQNPVGEPGYPANPNFPRFSVPGKLPPSFMMPPKQGETPLAEVAVKPVVLKPFDYNQLQVVRNNGRWELHAGTMLLKNFGASEQDARAAMRLIQTLRLTQWGTVGRPNPIMEFWLAGDKAPTALSTLGLRYVQVDSDSVRAEKLGVYWIVRDNNRILFNFGIGQQDAYQAALVIQQYGFNRMGTIGQSRPAMIYFLGDQRSAVQTAGYSATGKDGKDNKIIQAFAPNTGAQPTQQMKSLAAMHTVQQLARGYGQLAPAVTEMSQRVHFEPRQVKMELDGQSWKLRYQGQDLEDFGKGSFQAQQVLQWIQQYGCTEQCRIGFPETVFSYYLVNGSPAKGVKFSMQGQPFRPEDMSVKQLNQTWHLCDKGQPILAVGTQRQDAEQVLEVIRRYRFDFLARPVGLDGKPTGGFLVRTR
jgi:hypothetical protein